MKIFAKKVKTLEWISTFFHLSDHKKFIFSPFFQEYGNDTTFIPGINSKIDAWKEKNEQNFGHKPSAASPRVKSVRTSGKTIIAKLSENYAILEKKSVQ